MTLQLSSGIDSALMLAASKAANINVKPINFKDPFFYDESRGAEKISNFFGYDLEKIISASGKEHKIFTQNTDISNYINKTEKFLTNKSGIFILRNQMLLAYIKYGYHITLENSSYATALCLYHHTLYPSGNFRNNFFNPKNNSDLRFAYSKKFIESHFNNSSYEDNWDMKSRYKNIHPFYYLFLEPCFNGFVREKFKDPHLSIDETNTYKSLKKAITDRGYLILDKILLSQYIRQNLDKPSVEVAMKLDKLLIFINNISKSASDLIAYKKNMFNIFRPGLSSNILSILLSVEINQKLVNYPKWHIFKAFKILSGKDFFEITKDNSFYNKSIKLFKRLVRKKFYPPKIILENKFTEKFLIEKKVFNNYNKILKSFELYDHLKVDIKNYKNKKLGLINNLINMSYMKD